MRYNDSGEERSETEVSYEILKTLGHATVHVKQYVRRELTTDRYGAFGTMAFITVSTIFLSTLNFPMRLKRMVVRRDC